MDKLVNIRDMLRDRLKIKKIRSWALLGAFLELVSDFQSKSKNIRRMLLLFPGQGHIHRISSVVGSL